MKNSYSKIRLSTVLLGGMLAVGVLATNVAAETPAEDGVDFGGMLSVPTMLTGYGAIEQLDFDASTMVISGQRYSVSQTVKVEINGSYGAFTLLEIGMGVQFELAMYDSGQKVITEIYQTAQIVPE